LFPAPALEAKPSSAPVANPGSAPVANPSGVHVATPAAAVATPDTVDGIRARVPLIARFLPSLTDIAFLMPLFFIFVKLTGTHLLLGDGDTGWHIRTGQWILANRQVPHVDVFSFSRPGAPWFAWEWLWDVLFAGIHQYGGLASVVIASLAVICLTSVALFRLARRKCNNSFVAIAVTLLATGACSIHWLARPHLFTLLFFVISLHITERAAGDGTLAPRGKLLAWLVPMTLLWTNLHGGFFVIFLLLLCYVGGNLLNAAIEADREKRARYLRFTGTWALTALGCFAVTFINPYGWGLHRHIVQYLADTYQMEHIVEFQPVNFHAGVTAYFEPLMVLGFLTALWDARNRRFADVFLNLGWLHLALIAQRNMPLFALASAPLVARAISAAIDAGRHAPLAGWVNRLAAGFQKSSAEFEPMERITRLHFASIGAFALIAALLLAPRPAAAKFTPTYDPGFYPERALNELRSNETRHIFTDDEWGDYLLYHLYPSKRVFVDGRSDFYGDDFNLAYLDLMALKPGWQRTLDKYSIDTVALSPTRALTSALKISRDWRVVYDDGVAVVLRRTAEGRSRLTSSLVSSNEGKTRDRAITKQSNTDRKITQPGEPEIQTNQDHQTKYQQL
jgi:hypothetical protein